MFNADVNIRSLADSSSNCASERSCMKARWKREEMVTLPINLDKWVSEGIILWKKKYGKRATKLEKLIR